MNTRKRLKKFLSLFCVGVVSFLVTLLSMSLVSRYYFLPKIEKKAEYFNRMLPSIVQDFESILSQDLFTYDRKGKNAEEILSHFIIFDSKDSYKIQEIFSKYPDWKYDVFARKKLLNDRDFKKINLSWMRKLLNYDHWDLSRRSQLQSFFNKSNGLHGTTLLRHQMNLPKIDFKKFKNLGLAYLLKSHAAGNPELGAKVFRHMIKLAFSTGYLFSSLHVGGMLKDEILLYKALGVSSVEHSSISTSFAFLRLTHVWELLRISFWTQPLPTNLKKYLNPSLGLCEYTFHNLHEISFFRYFLRRKFLTDIDFDQRIKSSYIFANKVIRGCQQNYAENEYRSRKEIYSKENHDFLADSFFGPSQFVILLLQSISPYDYRPYEELQAKEREFREK